MLMRRLLYNSVFLTYVQVTSLNALSLSTYILDTLKDNGLDPTLIVSQPYDGASVMSGRCSGVQKHIKEVVPETTYITATHIV